MEMDSEDSEIGFESDEGDFIQLDAIENTQIVSQLPRPEYVTRKDPEAIPMESTDSSAIQGRSLPASEGRTHKPKKKRSIPKDSGAKRGKAVAKSKKKKRTVVRMLPVPDELKEAARDEVFDIPVGEAPELWIRPFSTKKPRIPRRDIPFSVLEDQVLYYRVRHLEMHGIDQSSKEWSVYVSNYLPGRTVAACQQRWTKHLKPFVDQGWHPRFDPLDIPERESIEAAALERLLAAGHSEEAIYERAFRGGYDLHTLSTEPCLGADWTSAEDEIIVTVLRTIPDIEVVWKQIGKTAVQLFGPLMDYFDKIVKAKGVEAVFGRLHFLRKAIDSCCDLRTSDGQPKRLQRLQPAD